MGFKDFVLKKMVESKMANVPKDQQEMILKLIEENPALFQKIAGEIQEEIKKGKSEMDAGMLVMAKYKDDLQKIIK